MRWWLLVLGAAIGQASGVHGTTFVLMDEADLAARSDAAVLGTVTAVRSAPAGDHGAIVTTVVIDPDAVVLGTLPNGPVVVHERGGTVGRRTEHIFGSAEYQVGERVLTFLSRGPEGDLHTTAMAMGKYRVDAESTADARVTRAFDAAVAVLDRTGHLQAGARLEAQPLSVVLDRLRETQAVGPASVPVGLRSLAEQAATAPSSFRRASANHRVPVHVPAAFTYLGAPSRWFEPDTGLPVQLHIDVTGDRALGADASLAAASQALAAWSEVDGSSLRLVDDPLEAPLPFAGCEGESRVVFNDPFGEIDPPVGCTGILGIGGFCTVDETSTVNRTEFRRIGLGKVTIAAGFAGCPFWTPCNLAEIITHEVGHTIGLGHSQDDTATMFVAPPFDGRCGGLAADDLDGLRAIYPAPATATPTPTATQMPEVTPTIPPRNTSTPTANTTPRSGGRSIVNGRIRYLGTNVPVAGVDVDLRGPTPQHNLTGAGGRFVFTGVDGRWWIEPNKMGDTGDAVTALDAAWVLQAVAGMRELTAAQQVACDVTGNGQLSALDAARILQRRIGEIDRFPAAALCDSDWIFLPTPAQVAGQIVVPPGFGARGCQQGGVILNGLQADATDQDFTAVVIGDCTASWHGEDTESAELAPEGTALEMLPLRHRPGGRWLQPIAVRAPDDVHALELELRYDPARLQLGRVRAALLPDPHVLLARSAAAGRVSIAVASAHPMPRDGRALIVVEFTAAERQPSAHLLRAVSVDVNERLVAAVP